MVKDFLTVLVWYITMIGQVESYDAERQTGVIKHKDKFYEFHMDEWNLDVLPSVKTSVDFLPEEDGSAVNIQVVSDFIKDMTPVKNHYVAGILGILFGSLGVHRIYLGFYRIAFLQVLITVITLGYGAVWGFIDGFLILNGQIQKDGKGRFLK